MSGSVAEKQEATRKEIYGKGEQLWKSVGIVIRGVITQAISKTPGPFAGGEKPSEVDCEFVLLLCDHARV